jgi:hypothetical protein
LVPSNSLHFDLLFINNLLIIFAGTAVAQSLTNLINPEDSTLRVLSIAGAFNKAPTPVFLFSFLLNSPRIVN